MPEPLHGTTLDSIALTHRRTEAQRGKRKMTERKGKERKEKKKRRTGECYVKMDQDVEDGTSRPNRPSNNSRKKVPD